MIRTLGGLIDHTGFRGRAIGIMQGKHDYETRWAEFIENTSAELVR